MLVVFNIKGYHHRLIVAIKPIRTQRDHAAALARIDEIFAAVPGTPEFDELDVLTNLVEAYEKVHHPIDPPLPIEARRSGSASIKGSSRGPR